MNLTFKINPVQSFISSSRSINDYHGGSLMLSMISYWAMEYLLSCNNSSTKYRIQGRDWTNKKCIQDVYCKRIKTGNLGFPHKFQFEANNLKKDEINNLRKNIKESILKKLRELLNKDKDKINEYIEDNKIKSINIKLNINDIIKNMINDFENYFSFSLEKSNENNFNKHNYDKSKNYNNKIENYSFNKKCDLFEKYEAIWTKGATNEVSTIENISYLSMLKKVFIKIVLNDSNIKNESSNNKKKSDLFDDDNEKMLAITFIDGDKIGNFISKNININNFYNNFTNFLDDFIFNEQKGIVSILNDDKYNNKMRLVYAGGDDVVLVSTADIAWDVNKKINKIFNDLSNNFIKENQIESEALSISSAIIYYKNKTPFSRLNKIGHKILEISSKENLGRNAITFYLIKNNTEYGWGNKWQKLIENNLFENNINYFKRNISESDIFKIQDILLTYSNINNSFFIEQNYHYIEKENAKYLDKLISGSVLKYIVVNNNEDKKIILDNILNLIKTEKENNVTYDLFALKIANFINETKGE